MLKLLSMILLGDWLPLLSMGVLTRRKCDNVLLKVKRLRTCAIPTLVFVDLIPQLPVERPYLNPDSIVVDFNIL